MTEFFPVPQFPKQFVSIPQSKVPQGSVPGSGHLLLSFGPCWTPIPLEERQAGGDRQTDSDRLRQSSFHGQAEGGRSSSSSGGLWAPQSWLRILAKLTHQLWDRCSCLNPVPQERHLLVIGTMEMAAGFWTWLRERASEDAKKGEQSDSVWGRRMVCSATSVFPFFGLQPHPPGQEPAKSKLQPIPLGEERSQGIGGKEGVRRVPRGAGLPVLLPHCWGEPHPPLFKMPLGLGPR